MAYLKIIIADDNENFRKAVKDFLANEFSINTICEAENGEELLKCDNIDEADIILMDINMPKLDGIATTKKILAKNSHLKIIAVTMHTEKTYLTQLIEAGFKGCIFKNNLFDEITQAIKTVLNNKYHFPEDIILR